MNSMTGYGKGTAESCGSQITIAISSVNGKKQTEIRCSIPRELAALETTIRQDIQQALSRGNLQINVTYQLAPEMRQKITGIDMAVAGQMAAALRSLADSIGTQPPDLKTILEMPGVMQDTGNELVEFFEPLCRQALAQALTSLNQSRAREGEALKTDLESRGKLIDTWLNEIDSRRDEALALQRKRLRERIETIAPDIQVDEDRLSRELVFYVERADITEEVVRLHTHIRHFFDLLNSNDPTGRNLDFLGQEMNREITTLSSKTADMSISETALKIKVEISKIREQIMNIE